MTLKSIDLDTTTTTTTHSVPYPSEVPSDSASPKPDIAPTISDIEVLKEEFRDGRNYEFYTVPFSEDEGTTTSTTPPPGIPQQQEELPQSTTTSATGEADTKKIRFRRVRKFASGVKSWMNLINVIMLGISMCTFFTAFNSTQSFITLLKKRDGFYALGTLYLVFAPALLLAPSVVDLFGPRVCLFFSSLTYSTFVLASIFKPLWLLLIAAAVNGLGAAVLWTAHGDYLVKCSGTRIGSYTGLFFGIFMLNFLIGNLLTSGMLSAGLSVFVTFFVLFIISVVGNFMLLLLRAPYEQPHPNDTQTTTGTEGMIETTATTTDEIPKETETSTDTAIQVDQPESAQADTAVSDSKVTERKRRRVKDYFIQIWISLKNTMKVMVDKRMLLFIPIALHNGFSLSVFFGVLPPQYGQRDKKMVGYVMAVFGASEVIGSPVFGKLNDLVGTRIMMALTLILHVCTVVLIWFMLYAQPYLFFVTALFCGLADSGYNTCIYSTLGAPTYFKDRACDAIAGFKMLQSAAIGVGFVLSSYAPFFVIKIILSVALAAAIVSWVILEFFVCPVGKQRHDRKAADEKKQKESVEPVEEASVVASS